MPFCMWNPEGAESCYLRRTDWSPPSALTVSYAVNGLQLTDLSLLAWLTIQDQLCHSTCAILWHFGQFFYRSINVNMIYDEWTNKNVYFWEVKWTEKGKHLEFQVNIIGQNLNSETPNDKYPWNSITKSCRNDYVTSIQCHNGRLSKLSEDEWHFNLWSVRQGQRSNIIEIESFQT